MKVAFDTNVLLDTILNRPGREDALRLMLAVSEEKFVGEDNGSCFSEQHHGPVLLGQKGHWRPSCKRSRFRCPVYV